MHRRRLAVLMLTLATAVLLASATPAAAATPCSATFHVLHNDRIGSLQLPEGRYRLSTTGISCQSASHLFTEFLQDYDGKLTRPWRYTVQGVGRGTFIRGSGPVQFTVARIGSTSGSPGPARDGGGTHGHLVCPGTFRVLHNDRIGNVRFPRGNYRLTRLGARPNCETASRLFASFLERPDGRLPDGWVLLEDSAEFVKGSSKVGFRVKRVN